MNTFQRPAFENIPGYISYYPVTEDQQSPSSDPYSDRITKRKQLHKEVEKRRRKNINDGITELSKLLPGNSSPKSKGNIISDAVNYIRDLRSMLIDPEQVKEIESWNYEKSKMQEEIKNLRHQIIVLKTENTSLKALQEFQMQSVSGDSVASRE